MTPEPDPPRRGSPQGLAALLGRDDALARPLDRLLEDLQDHDLPVADPELLRLLAARARYERARVTALGPGLWFRGFGWTMARALMALGILTGLGAVLLGPAAATALPGFLFGASAYYLLLHLWGTARARRAALAEPRARQALEEELREG